MYLMNGNKAVLYYNLDDMVIKVLDNVFLPYSLKDYIQSTDLTLGITGMIKNSKYIETLKDFLSNRVLNISKSNAKAILNSAELPATPRTQDRITICHACRGLSITDNFWLKNDNENITFKDVNLRYKHLKDAAFKVSILGHVLTISREILKPDLGTQGMFAKTWNRTENGIELWKTDKTIDNINTKAEIRTSQILDNTNVSHVKYYEYIKNKVYMAVCPCITNDGYSIISGQDLKDWCFHTNQDFLEIIENINKKAFAQMVVIDYLISNTDRHLENFAFIIDNKTNNIIDMAPLYDHNQALIADVLENDIGDLLYEPTGLSMKESAIKYFVDADLKIDIENCKKCQLFTFFDKNIRITEKLNDLEYCNNRIEEKEEL